jgi:hypothetical protein
MLGMMICWAGSLSFTLGMIGYSRFEMLPQPQPGFTIWVREDYVVVEMPPPLYAITPIRVDRYLGGGDLHVIPEDMVYVGRARGYRNEIYSMTYRHTPVEQLTGNRGGSLTVVWGGIEMVAVCEGTDG